MTTTAPAMPAMRRMLPEEDFFFFLAAWLLLSLSSEAAPEFVDVDGEDWARGPCLEPLGMSLVSAAYGRMMP
ncbi:hypothetical protein AQJ67_33070 [Streptomyces caeruleatus]|uniref:Uncharacterized protein n=1 Tax=Streptomyces caeruleatus TaxID=661399 RepID=A0A117RKN7_9ACTN|nr:hypothetical protein AQJ67_33070 [Streptomyces caeruleatus]